jgi:hypothetical protein
LPPSAPRALENAGRHAPIGAALGLRPGMTEEEGWKEIGVFVSDGPAGDERRAAVAAAVAENAKDFSQLGVEACYFYQAGALILTGGPRAQDDDDLVEPFLERIRQAAARITQ